MGYRAYVINGSLNFRTQPDVNSPRIASIPNGTALSVTTLQTPYLWRRTYYNHRLGYVMADFLNITSTYDNLVDSCIYFGESDQQQGSQGNNVVKLQNFLNLYNFAGLTQDGDFGPATKQAVKNYQSDRGGLTVDGVVGPATKTRMWNEKENG